jgi:heavy metal sensor kinase
VTFDWRNVGPGRLARSLRFRLTFIYVVFFAAILALVGGIFRQTLEGILDQQSRDVLEEEWAAVNGYLRWVNNRVEWFYDRNDTDEAAIVTRLQRVYMLTSDTGHILEVSPTYRTLGLEEPSEIREVMRHDKPVFRMRQDPAGNSYMLRVGPIADRGHRFFMAIGRPIDGDQRLLAAITRKYYTWLPLMILASALLGWLMAGRALYPVNEVAHAAERISSRNLNVQIPSRRSGDELDNLIGSFNRMIERLAAAFSQMRQFSTDVSHELRTPITAIRGQLEVALFTGENVEQYREAIENSLQDIERLSQIVKSLLLLSQAESGQLALQLAPLDFAEVVADIVDQYQIPAEGAGVTLAATVPERCEIQGDRVQLERMLYNLISNAVKFTPPGGSVAVKLEPAHQPPASVLLSVADTGRGIPPDHLPHIFDRFYRVPSAGKAPDPASGLGLGLSFVAWIVKAHGGHIDVSSEVAKGTRFTVTLPAGTTLGLRSGAIQTSSAGSVG